MSFSLVGGKRRTKRRYGKKRGKTMKRRKTHGRKHR